MPRQDGDIKVTNTTTGVRPGTDQVAERTITVEFTVRGKGPFSLAFPLLNYDELEARRQIEEFADSIIATLEIT